MLFKKFTAATLLVLCALAVFATPAWCNILFSDLGTFDDAPALKNFSIGTDVTVGSEAVTVTHIGYTDTNVDGVGSPPGDGFSHAKPVAIFRVLDGGASGELVYSTTIPQGTPGIFDATTSPYRFVEVDTPVILLAGTTYRLVHQTNPLMPQPADIELSHVDEPPVTIDPAFVVDTTQSFVAGAAYPNIVFPTTVNSSVRPNTNLMFTLGGLPEPATAGLLALSAVGLLRRRRRA